MQAESRVAITFFSQMEPSMAHHHDRTAKVSLPGGSFKGLEDPWETEIPQWPQNSFSIWVSWFIPKTIVYGKLRQEDC